MSFKQQVLKVVRGIPEGQTLSYKEVAKRAGSPKAYRVVGNIMKANYDPSIPCHRVIKSSGELGQYNRGDKMKEQKLRKEGAIV